MSKTSWEFFQFLCSSSLAIALFCAPNISAASRYSNIIIFGDSLSDIGNNTWVRVPGRGADFSKGAPITNLDSKTGKPKIWVQYLVKQHIFKQAFIIPSRQWHGQNLALANVDFAWASAETGQSYVNDLSTPFSYSQHCKRPGYVNSSLSCVPGMMLQVQQYLRDLKRTQAKPGKQTMFVLWAGGNDIFNNINRLFYRFRHSKFKPVFLWPEKKLAFSWFPTKKVYDAVELLIQAGVPAQHIYVFNLPNIAATPGAKSLVRSVFGNSQNKKYMALHVIAAVSKNYNNDLAFWLDYGIRDLQKPHIISTDVVFNRMISDNRFLGYHFLDVEHSCVRELATPYCTGFLFFNDKHPSTSASALFAFYVAQNL